LVTTSAISPTASLGSSVVAAGVGTALGDACALTEDVGLGNAVPEEAVPDVAVGPAQAVSRQIAIKGIHRADVAMSGGY
jgi:hypothetical protein